MAYNFDLDPLSDMLVWLSVSYSDAMNQVDNSVNYYLCKTNVVDLLNFNDVTLVFVWVLIHTSFVFCKY
jgi:hypothetical protein